MIPLVAIANQAIPEIMVIAPDKRRFSNTSSQTPMAATVKDNTALHPNTSKMLTQNHKVFLSLAAHTAANNAGTAITSG